MIYICEFWESIKIYSILQNLLEIQTLCFQNDSYFQQVNVFTKGIKSIGRNV